MTSENDWHRVYVHNFICECFHGLLKHGDEVSYINEQRNYNQLANLKLNSKETNITIKVTGNCSISSYVWPIISFILSFSTGFILI